MKHIKYVIAGSKFGHLSIYLSIEACAARRAPGEASLRGHESDLEGRVMAIKKGEKSWSYPSCHHTETIINPITNP